MGSSKCKLYPFASLFVALLLAGCSAGQVGEATPAPTAGATAASTTAHAGTATPVEPGMPVGLCTEDCVVTDFQVWQDFMPGLKAGNAPLHASVTLSIQWPQRITPDMAKGSITLVRASGEQVVTSDLQLAQWDQSSGPLTPGPQQVMFAMVPQTVPVQLTEGEMLHGTVALTLDGQPRTVELPEAALLFTH